MMLLLLASLPSVAHSAEEPQMRAIEATRMSPRQQRLQKRRRETAELARKGAAELQRSVRVFQQRYLLKSKRLELTAGGSLSLADPLINTTNVDGGLIFHIGQRWAAGVTGFYSFASRNDAFLNIQKDFGLFPERSFLQAGAFAEVQVSPLFGKFSSFGIAVLQMDGYLIGAIGGIKTSVNQDIKPAIAVGVGLRVHTTRTLTVSLEVRDILLRETFQSGARLLQHWLIGLKIGLWIPPTFQYKHQR